MVGIAVDRNRKCQCCSAGGQGRRKTKAACCVQESSCGDVDVMMCTHDMCTFSFARADQLLSIAHAVIKPAFLYVCVTYILSSEMALLHEPTFFHSTLVICDQEVQSACLIIYEPQSLLLQGSLLHLDSNYGELTRTVLLSMANWKLVQVVTITPA